MVSPQAETTNPKPPAAPVNWRVTRAHIASAARYAPGADTSNLRRAMRGQQLAEHVARVVDAAPPLTPAQRDAIALVLKGATLSDPRVIEGLAA